MSEFLDCPKNEILTNCPICGGYVETRDKWPIAGTHVFTVPYECGTEIDYPIGYDGAMYGVACDGSVKRYVMPEITPEALEKFKKLLKENK